MKYKLAPKTRDSNISEAVFLINDDGSGLCIPFVEANTDYQTYLKWLEDGNTPEPADEV